MKRTVLLTAIVLLLEVVIVGVLVPNHWLENSIVSEREMVTDWLGEDTTLSLIESTNKIYKYLFVDTNIVRYSYGLIPTEEERQRSRGFEEFGRDFFFPYVKSRIDVMWSAIYQSLQRTSLFLMWVPYMLPLFIPAIIDGLSIRNIKKVTYGYTSSVRYHTAYHILVLLLAAVPIYLAIPVAVTPISVLVWACIFSFSAMLMMANLQKKI